MKSKVSRRSFIGGAVVAGAAAASIPVLGKGGTAGKTWSGTVAAQAAALRAAYQVELERFAETLRPRFESGELRAFSSPDDDDVDFTADPPMRPDPNHYPQEKLEALCAVHFGLEETGDEGEGGDAAAGYAILAASPRAEATIDNWTHPIYHAANAVSWDVIAVARARGWYSPTRDECEDPLIAEECPDCGHRSFCHEEDGCHVGMTGKRSCGCKRRHVPHVAGFVNEARTEARS